MKNLVKEHIDFKRGEDAYRKLDIGPNRDRPFADGDKIQLLVNINVVSTDIREGFYTDEQSKYFVNRMFKKDDILTFECEGCEDDDFNEDEDYGEFWDTIGNYIPSYWFKGKKIGRIYNRI